MYRDLEKRKAKARVLSRAHYLRNAERIKEATKKRMRAREQYVKERKAVPCADCGVSYPHYVMDFDHRDPTQKIGLISKLVKLGNKELLDAEMAKCDVVCANCH